MGRLAGTMKLKVGDIFDTEFTITNRGVTRIERRPVMIIDVNPFGKCYMCVQITRRKTRFYPTETYHLKAKIKDWEYAGLDGVSYFYIHPAKIKLVEFDEVVKIRKRVSQDDYTYFKRRLNETEESFNEEPLVLSEFLER